MPQDDDILIEKAAQIMMEAVNRGLHRQVFEMIEDQDKNSLDEIVLMAEDFA